MKAQDILVLLKLVLWEDRDWTQLEMAKSLGLSASEVNHALKRLMEAKLYSPRRKKVLRRSALEFLLYGLKYCFPAKVGKVKTGFPTSHAVKPLSDHLSFNQSDIYIWPDPAGSMRGHALSPLYASAPKAAKNDPVLHSLLALCDAIRIGQVREVNLAREKLEQYLM